MPAPNQPNPASLLENLNDPQRAAVTHSDGPLLVLAGAGSGKTRVITRRAAYLASTVAQPREVLAITFTNKAANEMRERILALGVGPEMTVCTFHALGARLLRIHHERADLPANFTIYDTDDQRKVVKQAIELAELSTANWSPAAVHARISRAKNDMLTPTEFEEQADDWSDRVLARIYTEYQRLLEQNGAADFDDLLLKPARLLQNHEVLRRQLEQRYRYVLIDEYQDTNQAQYVVAHLLTLEQANICATGDPDQSIYGWRGADIGNILHFEEDYPSATVIRLEQNYRSTQRILAAADAVIAANFQRKEKSLWTENPEGARVRVVDCESTTEEAEWISAQILSSDKQGVSRSDIAVFYRINAMSRAIEEALLRAGIPYQVARGTEFYNRKEIKDVLAYLRLLINPADDIALLRAINNPPRGIGATTVSRLRNHAATLGASLMETVKQAQTLDGIGRSAARVQEFAELIAELQGLADQPPRTVVEQVARRSGLLAELTQEAEVNRSPLDNVNELINAAADFQSERPEATLIDWLEYTSLLGDTDTVDSSRGVVTLMTLHACKGLEFPVVFIIGLEDGTLPFSRTGEINGRDDDEEEEERRLCFVGMTRTMHTLTMTHCRYRLLRGAETRMVKSRFLRALPEAEVEWISPVEQKPPSHRSAVSHGRLPDDIELWEVGTLVRHPSRGLGQITTLRRGHKRTHVRVAFQDGADQSWVLEFADLTRVDYDEVG
ncbi:MAG: UvrD-helicase domain-containing protein [bacterium]|nr:UvrD-helicase domain-containing protein [bacterium]